MLELYPYILILHLFCAIFFIGYLFVDLFILGPIKRKNANLGSEFFKNNAVKIMPFIVLLLFLSGGAMASFHFNPLNLLFLIKMLLAAIIFCLVIFSLTYYFLLKKPNHLGKFVHPIVFIICFFIVILAKLMNYIFI
ncbi:MULTISPECIES: hypothetical protein [unclassified Campylobacter]|uniref:hypothetical protein n=1 Tax=unclassified Campylobacter TaxID=2593542 RepID=UPI001237E95D|nr:MULTISPECIES: hypothetical protein [unclassified Campylobacter]KAA6226763.1 hypothetical protein FMM55_04250 [Campylobacter sp. LR196d]KAA6229044.1 hypothetical protein FMM57_01425 [Campylobacter sp. LR286c]KAA6230200.1 hypothetical protein FMM58_05880 [Campylobacter sp. LR291e]KAA6233721.1 hypothetical protein FMM56_02095 [Campylobacter sp. LR264d]